MDKKVKTNTNKKTNIRQILMVISFIIIIIIGICITNNNKDNVNNTNAIPTVSYTIDTIPEYSSSFYRRK